MQESIMNTCRTSITDALCAELGKLGVQEPRVVLDHPELLDHGDFASNAALTYAKKLGMNPRALAEDLALALRTRAIEHVESVTVAGPGFVNITLAPSFFAESLTHMLEAGDAWGSTHTNHGTEVVCEYTDPNPFKAFHIGHLMSNAIGESMSRLLESQGATVWRANYQGDVGIHIACAIWGIQQLGIDPHDGKRLGEGYAYGATRYKNAERNPEWEHVKQEIDILNTVIYNKTDSRVNDIYAQGREASLQLFEELYALLGTRFDHYFFESQLGEKGKEIVLAHPHTFEDSDGAKVFKGEKVGLHTRVFLTKKGLPVYETKELALAYAKHERFPRAETYYVVTANEITEYYKVVVAAMREVDETIAKKMHHVPHGMMKLPEGKMSSRTGNVITGESLIQDLVSAARVRAEESRAENTDTLAEQIAVAAIKFQILRQGTAKDIIFEQEKALSLEGDSGPYLQYAHARCGSILSKGRDMGIHPAPQVRTRETLSEIERFVYRFPDVVSRAAAELEPHHVAHFLVETASLFNRWYAAEQILDGSDEVPHRLALVAAVKNTLSRGLHLLGIVAPEKM